MSPFLTDCAQTNTSLVQLHVSSHQALLEQTVLSSHSNLCKLVHNCKFQLLQLSKSISNDFKLQINQYESISNNSKLQTIQYGL